MPWTAYRVILRLHSPLHIGWGRVSYLQRTRPYVTGRVLRGALVSRVGRNQPELRDDAPDDDPYRPISKTFAQFLTFTYFYPALKENGKWCAHFSWENEADFRRRFMSSYVSTALKYPEQTAAPGLLYETEYIAPRTLDDGQQVYLLGYIFAQDDRIKKYDWQTALERLQLGGERGYGWGDVRKEQVETFSGLLFDRIRFTADTKCPVLHLEAGDCVLAHVQGRDGSLAGPLEPMVGREWRADNQKKRQDNRIHIGQHLTSNGVLYAPGSVVGRKAEFILGEGGYWQMIP